MPEDILQNQPPELDSAISSRLAKLRTLPVDVSRVEQAVREKTARAPATAETPWARIIQVTVTTIIAVAAIIAAIVLWRWG